MGDNVLAMGKDQRATVLNSIDRSTFKCSRTGADTCKCYCTKHRECCFKPGKRIKGTGLLGNTYNTVRSRQDCCNLCTNHPNCQGWTFRPPRDSLPSKCVLKDGAEFEAGDDDEIAGLRYSAVATC